MRFKPPFTHLICLLQISPLHLPLPYSRTTYLGSLLLKESDPDPSDHQHTVYPTPSKLTLLCPPPPPPSLPPTPASSPVLRYGRLHFSGPQKSHPMERNVPLLKWNNGVLFKLCSKIQFSPTLSFLPSTFVKPLAPAALPSASESLQMAKQKNKSLVKIHGKASGRAHHVSSTACLFHRHVLMLVVLYVHVK